ncbi:hypothetical protein ACFY1V_14535 [Streptomyces sp. NPDC001255]|uniref:hypothetical protein n=1 Tax=Streptomyces sp. NPDC001255 TaxID=3364550 RepID=UPI0036A74319
MHTIGTQGIESGTGNAGGTGDGLGPRGAVGGSFAALPRVAQGVLVPHVRSVRGELFAAGAPGLAGLGLVRWPRRSASGGGA